MRPWRPQTSVHSHRSPQNSGYGNCQRKAKHYSYLVIFGVVVYLEILFLSQWSLDSLLQSREPDSTQPVIGKTSIDNPMGHRSSQASPPDGTFNGFPVHLQIISNTSHTKPKSNIHCIGQNYQEDHWMLRSCNIRFMCFNMKEQEYEIYSRPEDDSLREWTDQILAMDISQTLLQPATGNNDRKKGDTENLAATVSLGGIPPGWGQSDAGDTAQIDQLKYFPKVRSTPPTSFYALPEDVVMIPYRPMSAASNTLMSILWDDYLSVFNLLQMFQFDKNYRLLLMLHTPSGDDEDFSKGTSPLMMPPRTVLTSRQGAQLELFNPDYFQLFAGAQNPKSDLICAKQGLMGTAGLTSHGTHRTRGPAGGKSAEMQKTKRRRRRTLGSKEGMTQNSGRGGLVSMFRRWALQNLDLDTNGLGLTTSRQHKIVLATSSNAPEARSLLEIVKRTFSSHAMVSEVQEYDWISVSPLDQVKLLIQTSVFVSSTPQDLATAPFLPSGASLILLYSPKETSQDASEEYWDLLNNLSHIRVHWFPFAGAVDIRDTEDDDAKTLVSLITRAVGYDDKDDLV